METPYWINGDFKWYIDENYQNYLRREQADNLPSITDLGVFRVVNEKEGIDDYVLINNKQEVIRHYSYNSQGAEQLEAFINISKIDKHFRKHERAKKD
jgi:hypothetical protein